MKTLRMFINLLGVKAVGGSARSIADTSLALARPNQLNLNPSMHGPHLRRVTAGMFCMIVFQCTVHVPLLWQLPFSHREHPL